MVTCKITKTRCYGNWYECKYGKGKGHPTTGREGPDVGVEVWLYCSIKLGAGLAVGGQHHAPAALPPRSRPGTHCIRG
jgi:hypothetical protein